MLNAIKKELTASATADTAGNLYAGAAPAPGGNMLGNVGICARTANRGIQGVRATTCVLCESWC